MAQTRSVMQGCSENILHVPSQRPPKPTVCYPKPPSQPLIFPSSKESPVGTVGRRETSRNPPPPRTGQIAVCSIYVFVSLERVGGWMCWDVSDATAPVFQSYVNSYEEDTAPESAAVISADMSPSGKPLLVAAYEESNTLAVFELTMTH